MQTVTKVCSGCGTKFQITASAGKGKFDEYYCTEECWVASYYNKKSQLPAK